jgi:hypothetical protein
MGTGSLFPRNKAWTGPDADHSTPYSAEVKNEYLLSSQAPPCFVAGQLCFAYYRHTNIYGDYPLKWYGVPIRNLIK